MPKYRENFKLNTKDIDLIEEALRKQMSLKAKQLYSTDQADCDAVNGGLIHEIQALLGKIHEQKIFYAQVNRTPHPVG